jgi:hypothetical protein
MSYLENSNGEKPWETLRWGYAFGLFIAPSTIVGVQEGIPVLGFLVGAFFCVYMASLAWFMSV